MEPNKKNLKTTSTVNQGGGGLPKSMTFFFKVETNDGWIVSVQGLLCSTKGLTLLEGGLLGGLLGGTNCDCEAFQ